ncbi:flagellar hook associated protein [bacterium 3DAC]|jgi:flagellar operon protein|nr:flagellar hook associated protein [Dictyoglomota bacterium]UZN22967.1 flagellar hook associated protein [bacterium 3DAC]
MIGRYKQIQNLGGPESTRLNISRAQKQEQRVSVGLSPFMQELASSMGIKFSKHALDRIRFRKIDFTQDHLLRLADGITKLRNKGVKEGVVVMDDLIAVVGVKDGTVITVKTPPFKKDAVFSQIDGVVFV